MRVDGHDSPPTAATRVDDQLGGYDEGAGEASEGRAAYPGDEHDFAAEHMTPTFSDELADAPGTAREVETPRGLSGMDS